MTIGYFNSKGSSSSRVPFANPGERYTSLIGGHTDIMYSPLGNVRGMVDSKQMRPIIVFSDQRIPEFRDVPTSKELGYDVTLPQFRAIVVKAGTDPQRVKTISDALARVYADKEYAEFLKMSRSRPRIRMLPPRTRRRSCRASSRRCAKVLSATGKN